MQCRKCESEYEQHSTGITRCTVCQRYSNIVGNTKVPRKRVGAHPGLEMTLKEFARWYESAQPLHCIYCGVPEDLVADLGLRTNINLPLVRLGVDRVDNSGPYRTDNIAMCCYACNTIKSNKYTSDEMYILGSAVRGLWTTRLAARGISWPE